MPCSGTVSFYSMTLLKVEPLTDFPSAQTILPKALRDDQLVEFDGQPLGEAGSCHQLRRAQPLPFAVPFPQKSQNARADSASHGISGGHCSAQLTAKQGCCLNACVFVLMPFFQTCIDARTSPFAYKKSFFFFSLFFFFKDSNEVRLASNSQD